MNLSRYQKATVKTFKEHKSLSPEQAGIVDWTIGLSGEVGEVSELIKHHIFHEEPIDKMKIAKEIGDVLWYLSALSESLDLNLSDIAELNLSKLEHRHGAKYGHASSADRHDREEKFEDTIIFQEIRDRILQGGNKDAESKL